MAENSLKLIGHDAILQRLTDEISAGRLAHAYLFLGPDGVGKSAMARWLVESVLGEHPELTGDFWHFADDGETLSIDTVRDMLEKASQTSWSGHRFIVIENVSRLRPETLNTLLKNLEEPTEGTHFVLTAHREADVLATLQSRCRVLRFAPVSEEAFKTAGYEQPWIQMAHGRPGLLLRLLNDVVYQKDALFFHQKFRTFLKGPTLAGALELNRLLEGRDDTEEWLRVFLDLAREEGALEAQESALRASFEEVQSWNSSANAKLALDSVFLPWVS